MIAAVGDVERGAGFVYRDTCRAAELCGAARALGVPRASAAGNIAHPPARDIHGTDAVTTAVGDVERITAYGYADRAVEGSWTAARTYSVWQESD